jgi:hypothetical protein
MAEIAIPLLALSALYFARRQFHEQDDDASMEDLHHHREPMQSRLPNVDIPDVNFPASEVGEYVTPATSELSTMYRYDGGEQYTDKYFAPPTSSSSSSENPDFTHNNMVPFYKKNSSNSVAYLDGNTNESLLDTKIGTGALSTRKMEQTSMFDPADNMKWTHGMPNQNDFLQARQHTSQRMDGVQPFETQQVGPGLGGQNGGNELLQRDLWVDQRTVDDLRPGNHQKSSGHIMYGLEAPGMAKVVNYGEPGKMEKNRPERMYESGPERWFTTGGMEKGQTLHAIPVNRQTNREDTGSVNYVGTAHSSVNGAYNSTAKIHDSSRQMLDTSNQYGIASCQGRQLGRDEDYGKQSVTMYPNARSQTESFDYFGAVGSTVGAVISPLLDIMRPTRKEQLVDTLRPYLNHNAPVKGMYAFDPSDTLKPTIRESTVDSLYHWQVDGMSHKGGYEALDVQVSDTQRSKTGETLHYAPALASRDGGGLKPMSQDAECRTNDHRQHTLEGYMSRGHTNVLSYEVNPRETNREREEKRTVVPSFNPQHGAPTMEAMGQMRMSVEEKKENDLSKRISDMKTVLQQNPYVHDVGSYFAKT